MFWKSMLLGLQALADWHIWVGILGIMIATFLWNALTSLVMGGSESGFRQAAGCLIGSLGGVLVRAIAVSFFVVACYPVILFGGDFMPLAVVSATATSTLMIALKSLVIVLILCFIPIVGHLISDTPGVTIFLQGILVFRPVTEDFYRYLSRGREIAADAFPGFWLSLGYVLIGCALAFCVLCIVAFVERKFQRDSEAVGCVSALLGIFFHPLCGVLPLLMYGKYVALSVQSSMNS